MEVNSENESGLKALDVLLQFQSEAGDLEIEATLLKAGAIRSRGVSSSVEPSRFASRTEELEDFFRYKKGRDKPSDVRTALLTVAALILTATYQAALSPPSGLWQDDGSGVTPQQNAGTSSILASPPSSPGQENNSDANHLAGKSILASRNTASFGWFVFGNSIGFYTASSTIVFLTRGFPLQLELQVSMFAIVTTYMSAMYGIIPGSKYTLAFIVFSVLLIFLPNIYKHMRDRYYRKKYSINVTP
ncbi:hypothetical protein L6164_000242 [Bauhinia variegata]|uniref:Uncharacterized protein n=1 Tax=Bauhinia variegata TaxID=167791 RepID=A0ACB9Q5V6_BAUVA|nr:hypothetical protein L6164_000242 [Bauhinia variegata]